MAKADDTGLYQPHLKTRGDKTWYWRYTDPDTGKRCKRGTGCTQKRHALRKVAEWQDDLERRKAGLKDYSNWQAPLAPLVDEFVEWQRSEGAASDRHLASKRKRMHKALRSMRLVTAADLDDLRAVNARLKALPLSEPLRRTYQDNLRQFTRWLAGAERRLLDRDPLACWEPVAVTPLSTRAEEGETTRKSRAMLPDEVARALCAADVLDWLNARAHPTRPLWETMLIVAPRTQALTSRDVRHLDLDASRIDLGAGRGKKRRGYAALDAQTRETLRAYVGDREAGPLFLSPNGARVRREKVLIWWRECFGLGVVDALWPEAEPWTVEAAYRVNQALLTGKVQVSKGGNPALGLRDDTREKIAELGALVARVVAGIGDEWRDRMQGIHAKGFRHTHETWALADDVPPVAIDRQLGHSHAATTTSLDVLRVASQTGRKVYLDRTSSLVDASRSAEAVRGMLTEAQRGLATRLVVPKMVPSAPDANQRKKFG